MSAQNSKPRFVAEVQEVIVRYTVEVSSDLLMWMDLGGTRVPGARIDDTSPDRAMEILERLEAIDGIEERSIEYNGHFGPFIYFACEAGKEESVTRAVILVIVDCERRMLRSAAHRKKAAGPNTNAPEKGDRS